MVTDSPTTLHLLTFLLCSYSIAIEQRLTTHVPLCSMIFEVTQIKHIRDLKGFVF